MTKRDVLSLALKILGIYSIIFALRQLPSIAVFVSLLGPQARSGDAPFWLILVTTAPFALSLIIAYILLRRGDSIARKLIKEDKDIPSLSSMDWESLLFILSLRIAGVACLIRVLPQMSNYLMRLGPFKETVRYSAASNWGGLISAIILLILGVYLLFGAKGFARFILKDKKPADDSPKYGKNENLL